jgi:endonuclease III
MKDSDRDVEQGLDCYDPETRVFPKITEKVSKRQGLSKRDLLLILKWKLGRIKGSNAETVSDDNLKKINEAIVDARKADGAIDALKALDKIPGIGLATATAMLTVCYPDSFTIIDERVLQSLELYPSGYENKKKKKEKYSTDDWTAKSFVDEYLPRVRERKAQWSRTLRETDQALWGLSVNQRIEKIIRKSEQA